MAVEQVMTTKKLKLKSPNGNTYTFKFVKLNAFLWKVVGAQIFGCDKITDWKLKELEQSGRF